MTIYCGVDFHARQQLVSWCDTTDGEIHQQQLSHQAPDVVREFYAQFAGEVIVGLGAGVSLKAKLRTKQGKARLRELSLSPAHTRQREEWLSLIAELNTRIERVEKELEPLAAADERVRRVRTHPGIGLLTGLALVH